MNNYKKQDRFDLWIDSWRDTIEEYGTVTVILWEINESLQKIINQIKKNES